MEASDLARRLVEFNATASTVLRDVPDVTGQQVRYWIVSPFLAALGWDPHDMRQVYLDYPVEGRKEPVDYALMDGEGHPKMFLEVRDRGADLKELGELGEAARAAKVPLALATNGPLFALWHLHPGGGSSPLFVLTLEQLAGYAEGLVGMTADYRLSDSGVQELRRSALRLAALQMLDQNSEKTFDALVSWVQGQVAPGELDETTEAAIREATMLWLTEDPARLPGLASGEPKRATDLRGTTPKDWETFPSGPPGTFRYKYDATKTLDLRQGAREVREQLRIQGLRTPNSTAFGGFYHSLRARAGLGHA